MAEQPSLPVAPDVYNQFISGLQLRSVRLVAAEVDAAPRFGGDPGKLEGAVDSSRPTYTGAPESFFVNQGYTFRGTTESGDAVKVSATFELGYVSTAPLTPELFTIFSQVNLPINVWPFFREFVHSSLTRAGWPAAVLPVHRRFPPRKETQEEES